MRKITPALKAQIRARRAKGDTIASIAERLKLSVGAVHNELNPKSPRRPTRTPATTAPAPAPGEPAAPPTQDDLRRWLAEQVTALRADAERYRGEGNASALASTNRALTAATALLERVTPAPPTQTEGTFVTAESMREEAAKGEERLMKMVLGIVADQKTWPKCHACGQHMPPADLEERVRA